MPSTATDLDGRRCSAGAAVLHMPVAVIDRDGNEVATLQITKKARQSDHPRRRDPGRRRHLVVGKHVVVS